MTKVYTGLQSSLGQGPTRNPHNNRLVAVKLHIICELAMINVSNLCKSSKCSLTKYTTLFM